MECPVKPCGISYEILGNSLWDMPWESYGITHDILWNIPWKHMEYHMESYGISFGVSHVMPYGTLWNIL
jgi:hypothetical protein